MKAPLMFEQQPMESGKAFAAFNVFLNLGVDRTAKKVSLKTGRYWKLVEQWSARYHWIARCAAYDAHLARVELEATECLVRSRSAQWLTRQTALREREWAVHEKCLLAAERALNQFLEAPKVFANLSDIARILEVASRLGRLSSGMPTEKTEVTGEGGGPIRVELSAALSKIYGEFVDVEAMPAKPIAPLAIEEPAHD